MEKIILGLGGSATNDGGTGAAAALGVRFTDAQGRNFIPVGDTLCDIAGIDMSMLDARLQNVEMIAMCDINNPLCGENGASAVFGPQKGATEQDIRHLDKGLKHFAELIYHTQGKDILHLEGGGAAGGMGAGVAAFFGASLQSGLDIAFSR